MRNQGTAGDAEGSNPSLSSSVSTENHSENSAATELSAVPNANGLPESAVPEACSGCGAAGGGHIGPCPIGLAGARPFSAEEIARFEARAEDERERMAADARAALASRGLVTWARAAAASEPGQPVLGKPTTDVPAEHGEVDLPVAVRPAGSTPAVGAPIAWADWPALAQAAAAL